MNNGDLEGRIRRAAEMIAAVGKIVVFTGAGVSTESGIPDFRSPGGLWSRFDPDDFTIERFLYSPETRKKQWKFLFEGGIFAQARPNAAHRAIAWLEEVGKLTCVITQNIDDLHERAGSKRVIHLHGEITKARSERYASLVYDIDGWELGMDAKCEKGFRLRPFIVWFGEAVPMMDTAISYVSQADIFIVIGTSLEVYPAASLLHFAGSNCEKYLIDPKAINKSGLNDIQMITATAGDAVPQLVNKLLQYQ